MFVSIVVSQDNVVALTLFEDHLYWIKRIDWVDGSIYRANKTDGTNKTTVITKLFSPRDIHMYHPDRQPEGLYSEPPTVYNTLITRIHYCIILIWYEHNLMFHYPGLYFIIFSIA